MVAQIENAEYGTLTVRALIRHWAQLAGTCPCGQFVVSMEGEGYYMQASGSKSKILVKSSG